MARKTFVVTNDNGEGVNVVLTSIGVPGEMFDQFVNDLIELRTSGWGVNEVIPQEDNGKAQIIVVDDDNGGAVGPFDSEEEAKAYFIQIAKDEEWEEVNEQVAVTGSPFGPPPASIGSFSVNGLNIETMSKPWGPTMAKITY